MSKKQKKSVESVEVVEVVFCKDCRNRTCGMESKRQGLSGYCAATEKYVARKNKVCDKYKGKGNA